jgi:hypothetical protein
MLSITPALSGFQDDCRREWFRTKDMDTKWRLGCLAFILLSIYLWAQVKKLCFSVKEAIKYGLHILNPIKVGYTPMLPSGFCIYDFVVVKITLNFHPQCNFPRPTF